MDHVTARVNDFAETRVKNHVKFVVLHQPYKHNNVDSASASLSDYPLSYLALLSDCADRAAINSPVLEPIIKTAPRQHSTLSPSSMSKPLSAALAIE
jgi:hypothetical protein